MRPPASSSLLYCVLTLLLGLPPPRRQAADSAPQAPVGPARQAQEAVQLRQDHRDARAARPAAPALPRARSQRLWHTGWETAPGQRERVQHACGQRTRISTAAHARTAAAAAAGAGSGAAECVKTAGNRAGRRQERVPRSATRVRSAGAAAGDAWCRRAVLCWSTRTATCVRVSIHGPVLTVPRSRSLACALPPPLCPQRRRTSKKALSTGSQRPF